MTALGDTSDEPAPKDDVVICIASIGRPSLAHTLRSLDDLKYSSPIQVIIADDSLDDSAKRVVIQSGPRKFPVEVYRVAARNIAVARNACLDRATGTFIAFLDDDEWAHPNWISCLVEIAKAHHADAVFGSVEAIYPLDTAQHIIKVGPFRKRPGLTGSRVITGATCNALVRRASVQRLSLRFDGTFGRSGGEDTDFFFRLALGGGVLVAAAEAIVYEEVTADRLESYHLQRRYMRGGYTFAKIFLVNSSIQSRLFFYVAAACKFLVTSSIAVLMRPIRADLALSYTLRSWGHIGKLYYALGLRTPLPY